MKGGNIRSKILVALGVILCAGNYRAQSTFEVYKEKFPDANGVLLKKTKDVVISYGKEGEIEISSEISEERLFLNDNYKYYLDESINYSTFYEITSLKPEVHTPTKKGFKKSVIKDITEEDVFDASVFHDDEKAKVFVYKGLVKGGKTVLNYSMSIHDPHFFGKFFFSSFFPALETELTITAPEDMEIIATLFGDEKDKVVYTSEQKGKNKVHTWKAKNLDKIAYHDNSMDVRYYATHGIFRIGGYAQEGEKKFLLRNTDDLYDFYYEFVRELNTEPVPALDKIADSIANGYENEYDKVKGVFYWVQDHIKYVAFEDGMGGFIPREAAMVCDRRYGDCKDMASILYYMINHIGADAHYTWVGSRDIPYTYDEVPTPAVDNHMICTYMHQGKPLFLDATDKEVPFGWPTAFIQGKQTLIGKGKDDYELAFVPEMDISKNFAADSVWINFDGEEIQGKGKTTYGGYNAQRLKELIKSLDNETRDEFYASSFKKGNNKSTAEVTSVDNLENQEAYLKFAYDFTISDYVGRNEDEAYINLFLKKYYKGQSINTKSILVDMDNPFKRKISCHVNFDVPKGYEVTFLPESSSFTSKDGSFGYRATFDLDPQKNAITLDYEVFEDALCIPVENFEEWNEFIKALNKSYADLVIIKKL